VVFNHVPKGTLRLSVLAKTDDDGLTSMNWSPKMIIPFEMEPGRCIWSSRGLNDDPFADETHYFVMWKTGAQYGVVTENKDKKWSVTWFEASDLKFQGRSFFLGGGKTEFDLAKGTTVDFPTAKAEAMGLVRE
jgi:hypothetical protein